MIPKIIHQLWERGNEPIPDFFRQLGETWKKHHPSWQYEFWDGKRMDTFVNSNYPHFTNIYHNYRYDIQRMDVIRFLILYKTGGMYVDVDYECLDSFDKYLSTDKCHFSMEPELHCRFFRKTLYFNNALMITPPGHPFFEFVIKNLQTTVFTYTKSKYQDVLSSTGPLMLTGLYEKYENKTCINLLPPEQVSPWSKNEVRDFINGTANREILEKKLENAMALHYFWGAWLNNEADLLDF